MSSGWPFQGSLFAEDFLRDSITDLPDWKNLKDDSLDRLEARLNDAFARFPIRTSTTLPS